MVAAFQEILRKTIDIAVITRVETKLNLQCDAIALQVARKLSESVFFFKTFGFDYNRNDTFQNLVY